TSRTVGNLRFTADQTGVDPLRVFFDLRNKEPIQVLELERLREWLVKNLGDGKITHRTAFTILKTIGSSHRDLFPEPLVTKTSQVSLMNLRRYCYLKAMSSGEEVKEDPTFMQRLPHEEFPEVLDWDAARLREAFLIKLEERRKQNREATKEKLQGGLDDAL